MNAESVKPVVKEYILREFLPGEDPDALKDDTEMFTQGILDSLASLKLVSFLEERFGVMIEAHEVDAEYLDSLNSIAALVLSKKATV
jgi:acyl carrier protein